MEVPQRGGGGEFLVLTERPYAVLQGAVAGPELDRHSAASLESLMRAAPRLYDRGARSALRDLVDCLRRGRRRSGLALAETAETTRKALADAGFEDIWHPLGLAAESAPTYYGTRLRDLIEIAEVDLLGRAGARAEEVPA